MNPQAGRQKFEPIVKIYSIYYHNAPTSDVSVSALLTISSYLKGTSLQTDVIRMDGGRENYLYVTCSAHILCRCIIQNNRACVNKILTTKQLATRTTTYIYNK